MMTTLARWDPMTGLAQLRDEVPRVISALLSRDGIAPTPVGAFVPALDLEETPEAFRLHMELPGVSPDAVEVSVEGTVLTVAGERPFYEGADPARFRRIERHFGRFHRALRLPEDVDAIDARYHGGILEIVVPRDERARPRRVRITTAA